MYVWVYIEVECMYLPVCLHAWIGCYYISTRVVAYRGVHVVREEEAVSVW